ncbi:hypothetical protein HK096_001804, partial [Nowakowskiella sp. JEL0078]
MNEYLAKKYGATRSMSLNDSGIKKKKRKRQNPSSTTRIIDEDESWSHSVQRSEISEEEDNFDFQNGPEVDDDLPPISMVFEDGSVGEAKFSAQNWVTIGGANREDSPPPLPSPRGRRIDSESPPPTQRRTRVHSESPPPPLSKSSTVPPPTNNTRSSKKEAPMVAGAIHRDKFGRKIDMDALQAEEQAKAAKSQANERELLKWSSGVAQREMQRDMAARIEQEKYRPLAIYDDDVERLEKLKNRQRWNDPMADALNNSKKKSRVKDRPVCSFIAPPNRYGLKPGHKWDGVDRSNGFENKWFQ